MRTPVKRSDTCIVKRPSAVILYISTGMPLVQSNYLVGTNCCITVFKCIGAIQEQHSQTNQIDTCSQTVLISHFLYSSLNVV